MCECSCCCCCRRGESSCSRERCDRKGIPRKLRFVVKASLLLHFVFCLVNFQTLSSNRQRQVKRHFRLKVFWERQSKNFIFQNYGEVEEISNSVKRCTVLHGLNVICTQSSSGGHFKSYLPIFFMLHFIN